MFPFPAGISWPDLRRTCEFLGTNICGAVDIGALRELQLAGSECLSGDLLLTLAAAILQWAAAGTLLHAILQLHPHRSHCHALGLRLASCLVFLWHCAIHGHLGIHLTTLAVFKLAKLSFRNAFGERNEFVREFCPAPVRHTSIFGVRS